MKTRIISGAALIVIVAALFWLQIYVPISLVIASAILGAMGVVEILYNTKLCENKALVSVAVLPALITPFVALGYLTIPLTFVYTLYAVIVFTLVLKFHSVLDIKSVMSIFVLPIFISFAFATVVYVTQFGEVGLFYILAVLCWSALADTGAYFIGVAFGKHKMAKIISPKKSWEGFVGGMLSGLVGVFLLCLLYDKVYGFEVNYIAMLLITPLFVALGVIGDLSASIIKRKCDIKDFGRLIPGHGGVMDRFDSILMITPLFAQIIVNINLIK